MDYYTNDIMLTYEKNKELIRDLWENSFDDPEGFVDYYFDTIYEKNKILSAYVEDELIGMVHLNPYNVEYKGEVSLHYYIVGVAVREDMQGKGVMKLMMNQVMSDIRDRGKFSFLMPKKQEYYNSLGFSMVYNTMVLEYSIIDEEEFVKDVEDNYSSLMLEISYLSELPKEEYESLANEINQELRNRYDIFALRDSDYIDELLKEHLCQHGDVCIVRELMSGEDEEGVSPALVGIFAYDIYDESMYVERFEAFGHNTVALITAVMKQAADVTCDRCIVTVAETDMADINHIASGVELHMSPGNGLMAVPLLSDQEEILSELESNCFFDEIV